MARVESIKIGLVNARCIATTFIILLIIPLFGMIFSLDKTPTAEKIQPVPPEIPKSLSDLIHFPGKYRKYFSDAYGFKGLLVRTHGLLQTRVFNRSGSEKVLLGDDGWLFLRGDSALDYHRNVRPFTSESLSFWHRRLAEHERFFADKQIPYKVIILPSKETIYDNKLPKRERRGDERVRIDQLLSAIDESTTAKSSRYIKVEPALLGTYERIYHKTDTHWNAKGAFLAYQYIIQRLQHEFPALNSLKENQIEWQEYQAPGGDLARLMGLKFDYWEDSFIVKLNGRRGSLKKDSYVPIKISDLDVLPSPFMKTYSESGEIDKAIIFRDSMAEHLIPFLSVHFKEAIWLWPPISEEMDFQFIENESPSLVLWEFVERHLMLPVTCPRLPYQSKFQKSEMCKIM
jgi:alginate O-acetyltransferase complex protein AlgJ